MVRRDAWWLEALLSSATSVALLAAGCGRLGYTRRPEVDAGSDVGGGSDAFELPRLDARPEDAFAFEDALDALTLDASRPDAAPECELAASCEDADACTVDACVMGSCVHTPLECADGHDCTMDVCSPAVGCMHPPDPTAPCELGRRCDPSGVGRDGSAPDAAGCVLAAECMVGSECDDGSFCTIDTCVSGVCQSLAVSCVDDGSACTGTAFCDDSIDACVDPFDPTSLTAVEHCGTSAATCVAPCPTGPADTVASCDAGVCGTRCRAGFVDLDGSMTNGCEYACTVRSAADPPDGVDENCDGADGVLGETIYVRPGGLSSGSGSTPDTAVTLERGLAIVTSGVLRPVLVAVGVYPSAAALVAPTGLALYGGYSSDFRLRGAGRSEIRCSGESAILIDGGSVALDGLDATTADQLSAGQSTRTLVVRGSAHLVLRDVALMAGRGGPGLDGARGADGASGAPGAASSGQEPGGIWREVGSGGRAPTTLVGPVGEGSAGTSLGACTAPGGGYCVLFATGNCMLCDPTTVTRGQPGAPGCAGAPGASGTGGAGDAGSIDAMGLWSPPLSAQGGDGAPAGSGGMGGGGGAGGPYGCNGVVAPGTGGGQGGSGGAPGLGGRGGGTGGGSFALVAVDSVLTLTDVTLTTVGGGEGGAGGDGGAGGAGGTGGPADMPIDLDPVCVPTRTVVGGVGGEGGGGGAGGAGGCGGGGAGGPSVGLMTGAGVTITAGASVTFVVGSGGAGGASCPRGDGVGGASGLRADSL